MVIKNITNVSSYVRKGVNKIEWNELFTLSNITNVIGKVFIGIFILFLFNYIFGRLVDLVFTKEIQRERNFDGLLKSDVQERTIRVLSIYGTLFKFLAFVLTIAFLARFLGIQIATIVIVFVFIIIIVIALIQGTIGNVIASLLISYFHTYEIGDIIKVDGIEGQVVGFNSLNTIIDDIYSTSQVTVPNKTIYASLVTNYSKSPSFVYTFYIMLSNYNNDFEKIINTIKEDLEDPAKYPYIQRNDRSNSARVSVDSYDTVGTKLKVLIPFVSTFDLINYKSDVKTKIRLLLSKHDIQLLDNYVYTLDKGNREGREGREDRVDEEIE